MIKNDGYFHVKTVKFISFVEINKTVMKMKASALKHKFIFVEIVSQCHNKVSWCKLTFSKCRIVPVFLDKLVRAEGL